VVKRHYKVVWDKKARTSLRKIYNYIKKRESEQQASKVRTEIRDLARSLGFMPHKYARDPFTEEETDDIRYKVIWSYRLVYEVTKEAITILDVVHTSRNPENMKLVK